MDPLMVLVDSQFRKKIRTENVFLGLALKIREVQFRKKIRIEKVFLGKTNFGAFKAKLSEVFLPKQFCPQTHHIVRLASKIGEGAVS